MSEYMFGVGKGELKADVRDRIDKVAEQYDCAINNPKLPGEGWRYWFAGPNLGAPFDATMACAVWTALEKTGLARNGELLPECFATGDVDGEE